MVINGADSNIATDGDTAFLGMDARLQPEKLDAGVVALSQNMRFDQYIATVRKGLSKQTNSITLNNQPLIVPFTVGSGATITNTVTDGVFGAMTFADPNNNNTQSLVIFCGSQAYAMSAAQVVASVAYPANEIIENTDTVDYFQYGGYVYVSRGDVGVAIGVSGVTSSSTTATVTTSAAHGLYNNFWVRIGGANQSAYNGDWQITVTSPTTFTYMMAGTTASPATGTITCNRLKLPMKWDGVAGHAFTLCSKGQIAQNFYYMNGWNFGITQVNRAIVEYSRNQLIISQVENIESYDIINGIFTFKPGTSDYLIGVSPYQDNKTLVFLRQSVGLINGVDGDVAAMSSQVLTDQVGCVAKRTISTCGANVLFLSERGVFVLQPGYELTLRGNSLPLSAPVQPFIQRINFSSNTAAAAYFNNRYYLAVPLDSSTRNNAMLVYNFINEKWESVDTFPNGFYCDFLCVMLNTSGVPTLYCLSYEGGVYAYEQNEMDDFAAASQPATKYLINGLLTTRRYTFDTNGLKQFNRAIVNYSLNANAAFDVTAITTNPDDSKTLPTVSTVAANELTRPLIIRKRAYGVQLQFSNTANRGSVVNYSIGAYVKDMKSTGTQ